MLRICRGAMFLSMSSMCVLAQTAKEYQAPKNLFSARVPVGWTVVERYANDDRMQQKQSLVDFVGVNYPGSGTEGHAVAVAITVRSTDAEGDSLSDYVADYLDIAGGPPGPSFKPYNWAFFRSGAKRYYSVDRLIKPVDRRSEVVVGGEKGIAFAFGASVDTTSLDNQAGPDEDLVYTMTTSGRNAWRPNAKLQQVIVKHGSEIVVFTLNSFDAVFDRDQSIFDSFLASVRWGHATK